VLLLLGGLAACGRTSEWVDPRTGILGSRGGLDLAGRPHGEWTWWYENGEIREHGSFFHGKRQGRFVQWYPGGQRHSEGERRFDPESRASPREGPWSFWYSNGRLRGRGSFEKGEPVGEWSWWDHAGVPDARRSGTYRDGRRE
jgi:antitoxin component YwqK of YwqJK toxin-antitoxin module